MNNSSRNRISYEFFHIKIYFVIKCTIIRSGEQILLVLMLGNIMAYIIYCYIIVIVCNKTFET